MHVKPTMKPIRCWIAISGPEKCAIAGIGDTVEQACHALELRLGLRAGSLDRSSCQQVTIVPGWDEYPNARLKFINVEILADVEDK